MTPEEEDARDAWFNRVMRGIQWGGLAGGVVLIVWIVMTQRPS